MSDPRIARFADVLIRHSRKAKRGQTVLVAAPTSAEALAVAVYRAALARGAHPQVQLTPPQIEGLFLEEASDAQLAFVSPMTKYAYGKVDHLIRNGATRQYDCIWKTTEKSWCSLVLYKPPTE